MRNCYREAIGSLLYLMIGTCPDIAFITTMLSRFMDRPNHEHWNGIKRVFKYLQGTASLGVSYHIDSGVTDILAYSDADWAGDVDTRHSTSGWICLLNGGPVSWSSRKQSVIATSTTEAELIAMCSATKEVVWLRKLLTDLYCKQLDATVLRCDNLGAISIVKNPESIKRTQHIETQFFYTNDIYKKGKIQIIHVSTNDQLADPLTKPLNKEKFQDFRERWGLSN